jgi:hypothetical protein
MDIVACLLAPWSSGKDPDRYTGIRGVRSLSSCQRTKERGEELFWALHSLLDAVTNLNLRDLEAEAKAAISPQEAKAESSTQAAGTSASASAKGKAKDHDPDWTEVPYNPVPITPLSTKPRFLRW